MAAPESGNFLGKIKRAAVNTAAKAYIAVKHNDGVKKLISRYFPWHTNGSFKHAVKTAQYLARILEETEIEPELSKEAWEEMGKYSVIFEWEWIVDFLSKVAEKNDQRSQSLVQRIIEIVNKQRPAVKPYALLVASRFAPEEGAEEYLQYLDRKFDSVGHAHTKLVLMESFGPDKAILGSLEELEEAVSSKYKKPEEINEARERREALNYIVADIATAEAYGYLPEGTTKSFVQRLLTNKEHLQNCSSFEEYRNLLMGLAGVHVMSLLGPDGQEESYSIEKLKSSGEEIYRESASLL